MESRENSSFLALTLVEAVLMLIGIVVIVIMVEILTKFQGYGIAAGIILSFVLLILAAALEGPEHGSKER